VIIFQQRNTKRTFEYLYKTNIASNSKNPDEFKILRGGRRYRVGNKVMQIKNN
jgi:hypothetical protein